MPAAGLGRAVHAAVIGLRVAKQERQGLPSLAGSVSPPPHPRRAPKTPFQQCTVIPDMITLIVLEKWRLHDLFVTSPMRPEACAALKLAAWVFGSRSLPSHSP